MDKLKMAIVKYNINLLDLFKKVIFFLSIISKYDKSSDHKLDVKEMGHMLKRIEPSINEEET
jgi:calcium-dependent protein kinase